MIVCACEKESVSARMKEKQKGKGKRDVRVCVCVCECVYVSVCVVGRAPSAPSRSLSVCPSASFQNHFRVSSEKKRKKSRWRFAAAAILRKRNSDVGEFEK